ncbi:helix-turn-helix transcriptional regulator [Ornithinibacillus gellani]|uniref:helix-turn-helix domain-containing protein n=1 Tax=Ornithinibacillus gellani TaxID=2293253 RepID=UPI000F46CECA|nr:helix-turn-helix transcriptional regulator [Ornithinibacillus gellani]TQS75063.1 helix-turn-helix transcriptional regulator [Ornithinibacillus gellani]
MKILEGKIIKFYRELQQLRQKDLVEGVCSTTHISKIERGQTEASGETVELISERLGIDMHEQLKIYA